ncbi:MAG: hypothetical protein JOZ07_10100 [Solirubrobacterales bacterium]|nr:hypothetical protein [Solirubrobacterales bacterium]
MARLCFDLDGTLCTNTGGDHDGAEPFPWAIARVNRLAAEGHRIVVFTARGTATGIDWLVGLPFCLLPVGSIDGRALAPAAHAVVAALVDEWSRDAGVELAQQIAELTRPATAPAG